MPESYARLLLIDYLITPPPNLIIPGTMGPFIHSKNLYAGSILGADKPTVVVLQNLVNTSFNPWNSLWKM